MKRILFVCTGNICRSPTAEGIARARILSLNLAHEIEVDSAATQGSHVGEAPDPRTLHTAKQRGHDFSKLRARKVTPKDFADFDLIIALDKYHMAWLDRCCPVEHKYKLHSLMEYAPHLQCEEVPDPYYGGPEGFEEVFDMCEEAIEGLLRSLNSI